MTDVEAVDLRRLRIPLREPYHLSHTTVDAFDVIVVTVTDERGRTGVGEVTPLEGYSRESGDEAWSLLTDTADDLPGRTVTAGREHAQAALDGYDFSRAGIDCALETLTRDPLGSISVPIVGILSTDVPADEAVRSLGTQLDLGFETVKVKIGFDPERDATRLEEIVEATPRNVDFRVDANQGYTLAQARTFLDAAPLDRLQLVEQPLPTGKLSAHARLNGEYDVTVMLDEEITESADLEAAAAANAADAVKFKLMKAGGWRTTEALIERARSLGFDIVLGNGVQSDIACVYEAAVWEATDLTLAGECNGWRKQERRLLDTGLDFEDGCLCWDGDDVSPSRQVMAAHAIDRYRCSG